MPKLYRDTLKPINSALVNCFADSIVPQLFVDSAMNLRHFTEPAGQCFSLSEAHLGRSIHMVKEKIGYPALVEKIRGVVMTETRMLKEVKTSNGAVFQMNIQPFFCDQELMMEGVIVTFLKIP